MKKSITFRRRGNGPSPSPRRPLPATQAEVASLAGCCRQTVAKWQKGCAVLPALDKAIRQAVAAMLEDSSNFNTQKI